MSNIWLKIKIVRDFNMINKTQNSKIGSSLYLSQKNRLYSFSSKYINLLELIKNIWYINFYNTNISFPNRKLFISDLNFNVDTLEEIINLNNVEIVNAPYFTYMYVENNNLLSKSCRVETHYIPDIVNYIKSNPMFVFHIYEINDTGYHRFYKREDRKRLKKARKEKIKNINKIYLEI